MNRWIKKLFGITAQRITTPRVRLETNSLEDRTTPAVTFTFNADLGYLQIRLNDAADTVNLGGSSNFGNSVTFSGTGLGQQTQTNVFSVAVTNNSGVEGAGNTQVLNISDFSAVPDRKIILPGRFLVSGVAKVVLANEVHPLAANPISISSQFLRQSNSIQQLSASQISIVATGTGDAVGTASQPIRIVGNAGTLASNTSAGSGNQYFDFGNGALNVNGGSLGQVTAGNDGVINLLNGQFFGQGANDFGDKSTFNLGTGGIMSVFNSETIGGLTGTGLVGASAGGTQTLIVGNGTTSTQFDGSLRDVAGTTSGPNGKLALATAGTGTFTLNGANTFTGGVTVNTGSTLRFLGSSADRLAAKSNVTVNAGGILEMAATNPTPSTTNSLNLTLNGGTYQLSGTNNSGTHLGNVTFNNGGTIKANGTISSFAGSNLALNGNVSVAGSVDPAINLPNGIGLGSSSSTFNVATGRTLSLSNTTGLFDGDATTPQSLIKQGAGTLRLDGPINLSRNGVSNTGNITVSDGTLFINGTMSNGAAATDVVVNGTGTLRGTGNIQGTVSVASGATVVPGNPSTLGTLSTGNISFASGSTFVVSLTGIDPGFFNSLAVSGSVNLGNATLSVSDLRTGGSVTIISNDGTDAIQGTFAGLPEGATVTGNANKYIISYRGGDGNDVTLTRVFTNTPPVARNDFATTTKATAVTIDILANDTDADGDPLTVVVGNAANGTVTFVNGKAIYTPNAQFVGEDFFGYTVTDGKGGPPATARATINVSGLPVSPPPPVSPPQTAAARENLIGSKQFAVGSGEGGSTATLHNADNSVRFTVTPFPGQFGGVRVAVADFDLDGIGDLVVGTGPGGPTEVKVYNGKTQAVMFQINPFEAAFKGGVFLAAGSLTGEFGADLAISPDEGGGPRVRLFGGIGAGEAFQVADFFGIEDPNFRGGARVTMGDINGDGKADLVVAAGFGGGPRIAAFSGASFFVSPDRPVKLFGDFLAFEDTLRNGTFVAVGDVDGDGRAELIAGGGPGGGPRVSVFTGVDLLRNVQTRQADFFAGAPVNRGGVRLAVADLDSDGQADLVTGSGPGVRNQVTNYFATSLTSGQPLPASFFEVSSGLSGVFVG
jgi:autotransporter-associated beta strand protein